MYQIKLAGDISVADIVALGFALFFAPWSRRWFWFFGAVIFIFLLHQYISDVYAGTPLGSTMRGLGRTLHIFGYFIVFQVLEKHRKGSAKLLFVSMCVAQIVTVIQMVGAFDNFQGLWRHGVGEAISLIFISFFLIKRSLSLTALLVVVIFLNLNFDFRGMAALSVLALALGLFERFLNLSFVLKVISLAAIVSVVAFVALIDWGEVESSDRAKTSNEVRFAMMGELASGLVSPKYLGFGYESFERNFSPPTTGNALLDERLGSERLGAHGYFLSYAYEAGKFVMLCWLLLITNAVLFIGRNWRELRYESIIMVYFVYGAFFLTPSSFDKYIIAFSLFLIFSYRRGMNEKGICRGYRKVGYHASSEFDGKKL
ncbi:hypothetical protein [Spongiibacter tropicus]|uniref:hypothetical protein n=1 Tax=Spongiibacter tropicus TaxID=454602 RepID=UPI0035BE5915